MSFIDAIKICFNKYADFNGCASRPELWWWVLFTFLGSVALRTVSFHLSGLFSIAMFLPSIAVGARRLHDTDRSGWFQLLGLIPIAGLIILIIWFAEPGKANRYGGTSPAAPTGA